MSERKPFLYLGLGLAGLAGYQLLQKPAAAPAPPPATCPAGYHLEGGLCVQDPQPPAPPPPPATGYRVERTGGVGLIVRSGPGTQYARVGGLAEGAVVQIACQTIGQRINTSSIWDRLSGPIAGYVSDWYISTPNIGTFSPGLAICSGSLPAPPPPPVLPPTGKAALSSLNQIVARMIISTGCGGSDADYVVLARRSTATATPPYGRVWIKDAYTWAGLGAPRSAIWIVSRTLLLSIPDAGTVRRTIVRNYGEAYIWDAINGTVWDTAMNPSPGIQHGGFSVLKTPAGWCA